jgi:muramoyltetrapeptide carboxypeptidase
VVTVVAPSGPFDADRVRAGAAIVESWGLEVRYGQHALGSHKRLSYLSADDRTRAADFTAAWTDPATSAVWAARGGYGAQRMVDMIDFDRLRAAGPKHLVGFSDITALHARVGRELGQVTIHGPVVASLTQLSDAPSVAQLQKLLLSHAQPGTLLARGPSVHQGLAQGRLVGGNLSLVASDLGIEPIPAEPRVAVFEDVAEDGYRIDRMLTQLLRAGWFNGVVGIVIGDFAESAEPTLIEHVVADRLDVLGVPILRGARVGHGVRNLALPLGAQVRLDATAGNAAVLTLA